MLRTGYKDPTLVYVSDLQYYSELSEDREKQAKWLKDAYWLTTDETRAVMDYGDEYDPSQILVPSGLATLSDVAGGDLNTSDESEDFHS